MLTSTSQQGLTRTKKRYDLAQQALTHAHQIAASLQARRIHWQILLNLSALADQFGDEAESAQLHQKAHAMLGNLVESIPDGEARTSFMRISQANNLLDL